MKSDDFEALFISSLETAAKNAEAQLDRKVPHAFDIELHGLGYTGRGISVQEAAQALYIDEDHFYRVIDVAVTIVTPQVCHVFVRPSGHPPGSFEETMYFADGTGPFHQIIGQITEQDTN